MKSTATSFQKVGTKTGRVFHLDGCLLARNARPLGLETLAGRRPCEVCFANTKLLADHKRLLAAARPADPRQDWLDSHDA